MHRKLGLLLLFLSTLILVLDSVVAVGQSSYWEDDDWTFTIGQDQVVSADVLVTIHPGDQSAITERNITFAWFTSDFQARDYQTDLELRTTVVENKTSGSLTVSVFFARPRSDGYKFKLHFTLLGRIENETVDGNETFRFAWRHGVGVIHQQHFAVKFPPHYTIVPTRSTLPTTWEKSVERDLEVIRFNGPPNATTFSWAVSYAHVPPTIMETIADVIQAQFQLLSITASAIGLSATVLGYFLRTRKRRFVKRYLNNIDSTFNNYYTDKEKCRRELALLREKVDTLFTKGKIDEAHHEILTKKAEWYLEKL